MTTQPAETTETYPQLSLLNASQFTKGTTQGWLLGVRAPFQSPVIIEAIGNSLLEVYENIGEGVNLQVCFNPVPEGTPKPNCYYICNVLSFTCPEGTTRYEAEVLILHRKSRPKKYPYRRPSKGNPALKIPKKTGDIVPVK